VRSPSLASHGSARAPRALVKVNATRFDWLCGADCGITLGVRRYARNGDSRRGRRLGFWTRGCTPHFDAFPTQRWRRRPAAGLHPKSRKDESICTHPQYILCCLPSFPA